MQRMCLGIKRLLVNKGRLKAVAGEKKSKRKVNNVSKGKTRKENTEGKENQFCYTEDS